MSDDTFCIGLRVTVPDAGKAQGTIVGFGEDDHAVGVLFDNVKHGLPIYFDVDMVQPADSDANGGQ